MAITTVNGIAAGLQPPEEFMKVGAAMEAAGILHSLAYTTGRPGAMTVPAGGLNGTARSATVAGQIPFANPASGNAHLALLEAMATQNGTLLLCDRLWDNSGIAVATLTAQAITSPAWPSRCVPASGSTPDALGGSILVGLEVSTATTNAGAITNTTLNYTNSANVAARTGTMASFPATAVAGTFVPFQLAAGDIGVRSIQGVTLGTSYAAGAIHLVAYRVIARIGMLANIAESKDWGQLGLPRMYDGSVPFLLWLPSSTTAVTVSGGLVYAHG